MLRKYGVKRFKGTVPYQLRSTVFDATKKLNDASLAAMLMRTPLDDITEEFVSKHARVVDYLASLGIDVGKNGLSDEFAKAVTYSLGTSSCHPRFHMR